jgi:hypothetical protein
VVTRLDKPGFPPLLSTTKHKINGTQPPQPFLSVIYVSGTQIYLGTKVEEASLLVPTELGKGVESLLEQDSKPNHLVVPFTPVFVNPSYWQQDGAKASGFKVSLHWWLVVFVLMFWVLVGVGGCWWPAQGK